MLTMRCAQYHDEVVAGYCCGIVAVVSLGAGAYSRVGILKFSNYTFYITKPRINLYAQYVLYIAQAFRCSPESAFYIFNQQIYFII